MHIQETHETQERTVAGTRAGVRQTSSADRPSQMRWDSDRICVAWAFQPGRVIAELLARAGVGALKPGWSPRRNGGATSNRRSPPRLPKVIPHCDRGADKADSYGRRRTRSCPLHETGLDPYLDPFRSCLRLTAPSSPDCGPRSGGRTLGIELDTFVLGEQGV
jgi:hypothetical protein